MDTTAGSPLERPTTLYLSKKLGFGLIQACASEPSLQQLEDPAKLQIFTMLMGASFARWWQWLKAPMWASVEQNPDLRTGSVSIRSNSEFKSCKFLQILLVIFGQSNLCYKTGTRAVLVMWSSWVGSSDSENLRKGLNTRNTNFFWFSG